MKKFSVNATVRATRYYDIEAETEEQAEKAIEFILNNMTEKQLMKEFSDYITIRTRAEEIGAKP